MVRIIIILAALNLALGAAGWYLFKQWRTAKAQTDSVIKLNGTTFKEVEYYRNKAGELVTKNESLQLQHETILNLYSDGQLQNLNEFNNLKRN